MKLRSSVPKSLLVHWVVPLQQLLPASYTNFVDACALHDEVGGHAKTSASRNSNFRLVYIDLTHNYGMTSLLTSSAPPQGHVQRLLFCCADRKMAKEILFLLTLFASRGYSRGPCDPLVPEYCQLPLPNAFFTRPDPDSPTGVRVNLSIDTWPKDILGRSIDPGNWNTMGKWGFTYIELELGERVCRSIYWNLYIYIARGYKWAGLVILCAPSSKHKLLCHRYRPTVHKSLIL